MPSLRRQGDKIPEILLTFIVSHAYTPSCFDAETEKYQLGIDGMQ
jgi:hypothetical protein